ncbi:MAG: TlpA disulfide reductase family protein [Verrucomicrobiota bacterium]
MKRLKIVACLLPLLCAVAMAGPVPAAAASSTPARGAAPPAQRPEDFTLPGLDGQPVALSRYLGKTAVLLVFWATWCPECRASVPSINAIHDGPAGGRIRILAIDYRESREQVASAVKARGIRYPVLLDGDGSVAAEYGIVGVPTYILIDRKGSIAYRDHVLPSDLSPYL